MTIGKYLGVQCVQRLNYFGDIFYVISCFTFRILYLHKQYQHTTFITLLCVYSMWQMYNVVNLGTFHSQSVPDYIGLTYT